MLGIGVGMQQRYRDGLRARLHHLVNHKIDGICIERLDDAAGMIQPLGQFKPAVRRNLRLHLGIEIQAIEVTPVLTADLDRVGKSFRRNQRDLVKVILDNGIRHHRRTMNQIVDVRPGQSDGFKRREKPLHTIVSPGVDLCRSDFSAAGIQCNHVGESTADVDSNLPSLRHKWTIPI